MKRKLIIDGNAVYEIDEDCMVKRRIDIDKDKASKRKEGKSRMDNKKDVK